MGKTVSERSKKQSATPVAADARRIPTQQRSRERVERMLSVAARLIAEKGGDAVTMSEIADAAEVSIGSLYQFFPDKSAILRTLGERYNAVGVACVRDFLASVDSEASLKTALDKTIDGFYQMYLDEPVMRYIWQATQGDKSLQDLDAADMAAHAELLQDVFARLRPKQDRRQLATLALVTTQLLATAVRLAVSRERKQGDAVIQTFKRMQASSLFDVLGRN